MSNRAAVVTTDAIVLRRFDYSETSQIARLFTRAHGRVSVIAKGIKRPNRDLQGPIDLLCLAKVAFAPRTNADLLVLREYHVTSGFSGLRMVLERLIAAFYLVELLCEGTRDHDPDPALFDLWVASLHALEAAATGDCDGIVMRAELGFLELSGFLPSLVACVRCGAGLPAPGPARLVPLHGGLVCDACGAQGAGQGIGLTAGQRRTLGYLATSDPGRAQKVAILPRDRRVLRRALSSILDHVLEKELHSAAFLSRSF